MERFLLAERFEVTAARRIERLERALRDQSMRHTSGYSPGDAIATALAFPELRAFWAFSSINEAGAAIDLSGQGRTLTNNGGAGRSATASGVPYAGFNGSSQYFSRADEAGLDITGGLTIGGWFYPGTLDASVRGLIVKWTAAGDQRSYQLYYNNAATSFGVSSDGSAGTIATANGTAMAVGTWNFVMGRFFPSTNVAVIVNDVLTANETSIPASIHSSSAPFEIGRQAAYFGGFAALCFVCASTLPLAIMHYYFRITRGLFGV